MCCYETGIVLELYFYALHNHWVVEVRVYKSAPKIPHHTLPQTELQESHRFHNRKYMNIKTARACKKVQLTYIFFKKGFRPSLSPTGDVFDDSNNNIAAAIVDGLNEDPTTETEEQETEQAPAEPAVEQTEDKEEENTTKQEEAEEKDDASDDSSATDATVEIKVAQTNQSIPDVVPKGLGEREVSHVDIDDKEKLTKTTDLENEIEEATTPAKFDGVAEPARRNSAV